MHGQARRRSHRINTNNAANSSAGSTEPIEISPGAASKPRHCWNAIILLIGNDREQLRRTVAALCRDNTELGQMPSDRIRQHRSLTNQKLPATMQHQARLLLLGFRCDSGGAACCYSTACASEPLRMTLQILFGVAGMSIWLTP